MESQLQLIRKVIHQLEVENNKKNWIYPIQNRIWIPVYALLSILTINFDSVISLS